MIDELVIVGVGLIGGSMARAARQHGLAKRIVGVDQRAAAAILDMGLVDESFESLKAYGKARHHDKGDHQTQRVLVMAVPPTACAALLADVIDDFGSHFWTAVTDVSSTKHAVVDAIDDLRRTIASGEDHQAQKRLAHLLGSYVSSHPMAGSELNGPSASRADLFVGARVFVSDWPETHESATALIEGLWLGMGGQPVKLPIQDHDALLAAISHFPHLVSFVLAGLLCNSAQASAAQSLHGGGLRDTTRIAGSSPELWADILLDNRDEVLQLMPQWQLAFGEMVSALQVGDRQGLMQLLQKASHWRRQFS